ncbi:hypothetical protein ETAA8_45270 [Anatilimnocola aggregata]|uniref:Uncharacterized protein n=1 Tax=Anatilimnocola aggregata TaxID=2528021 RepID=A0A517YGR4_9BACT|nr:hypothetical protein [Anatilimnocola aggregata]QDU29417.1 hypothetical protein ETAA8_45270 [Anatilimnocola aggregata]
MSTTFARLVIVLFGILGGLSSGQDAPPPKLDVPRKPAAMYVPPPPPTTDQMRAEMNGLFLPSGFQHEPLLSPNGEVGGLITGPDKFKIAYWVMPPFGSRLAPGQVAFESLAMKLKAGKHQWSREQYVSDELIQLTLASDNTLAVSYPNRGVNMSCNVNGPGQLSDALLMALSITNTVRRLSWDKAKELFEKGGVKSCTMFHTGVVFIHMADETRFETRQPSSGALIALIRALGKEDKIGIATD